MSNTAIAFLLVGVLLNAAAQLLLKAGTTAIGEFEYTAGNILDAGLRYALQPYIVAGLSCYVVSVVVWLLGLSRTPVSVAYPMLSLGYLLNAVAAWHLFGESLGIQKLLGMAFIIIGVALVTRS